MTGYIDMHCDTLSVALQEHKNSITTLSTSMVDIHRLKRSGAMAQFCAIFLPQQDDPGWFGCKTMPPLQTLLDRMYQVFRQTLTENRDYIRFAGSGSELKQNASEDYLSLLLTLENGCLVDGKIENLKKFYDMGVRLITLTWNDPNCFGQNHSKDSLLMQTGLTDFGKEAVSYMNELGMVIDVSHLSDGGFYDVATLSKKPFVASHSNCRAVSPATRNLTDDMIRVLSESGGCAGLNFAPDFLDPTNAKTLGRVTHMCDHVEHLYQVGGEDCLAIGTDFDGIDGEHEIDICDKMELLFDALKKRGITERILDKMKYENVLRVLLAQE